MRFTDYYRVMGVAADATPEQIKTAYRSLARRLHPDVSKEPGTVKRFTDLGEAYEVLQDPARRAAYDRLRAGGWKDGQEIDAPPPGDPRTGGGTGGDNDDAARFSDFFQSMFGGPGRRGSARRAYPERGEDVQYTLPVTLEEAYRGGERQFTLQTPAGGGQDSAGTRTITVKIPAGVMHGTRIRLRGQGHPGSSRDLDGDLYLEVELAVHRLYRVDGCDVTLAVPIAPWEAVLGAQVEVPTLGGMVTATIPAGAQQGQRLRLKGRGLPHDPPGDQYLSLQIAVPATASDAAKELYRALAREAAAHPRARFGG